MSTYTNTPADDQRPNTPEENAAVYAALGAEYEPYLKTPAWKLVPVEPSIAMCITGASITGDAITGHVAAKVYAAMLHAAHPPAAPQDELALFDQWHMDAGRKVYVGDYDAALTGWLARAALPAQAVAPAPLLDHQIRDLVNELRDIALQFHAHDSLRSRIARAVAGARGALDQPRALAAPAELLEPLLLNREYQTQGGETVRFYSIANAGTSYETMEDQQGRHRYTRRAGDSGRLTGTAHDWSDPGNVRPPLSNAALPAAQPADAKDEDSWPIQEDADLLDAPTLYAQVYLGALLRDWPADAAREAAADVVTQHGDDPVRTLPALQAVFADALDTGERDEAASTQGGAA